MDDVTGMHEAVPINAIFEWCYFLERLVTG